MTNTHLDSLLLRAARLPVHALAAVSLLVATGCGDDGSDIKEVDAAVVVDGAPADTVVADAMVDAPPAVAKVISVTCPATPAQTVTTTGLAFTPATITVAVNAIVRFAPTADHNVVPHPMLPTDPGMVSGALGAVKCLQFTTAGEYNYRCGPHAVMNGKVTVQ